MIAMVDYGMGNRRSVEKALAHDAVLATKGLKRARYKFVHGATHSRNVYNAIRERQQRLAILECQ